MPFLKSLPESAVLLDVFRAWPDQAIRLTEHHQVLLRDDDSDLTPGDRELIAAFVSRINGCRYCSGVHTEAARLLGYEEGTVDALLAGIDTAPVADRMKPVLRYVEKLTRQPASLTQQDADAVFAAGWGDKDLHDAVAVCAMFNFMNRFVEGLGIEADEKYFKMGAKRLVEGGYSGLLKLIGG